MPSLYAQACATQQPLRAHTGAAVWLAATNTTEYEFIKHESLPYLRGFEQFDLPFSQVFALKAAQSALRLTAMAARRACART